jgi:hypothetical protein
LTQKNQCAYFGVPCSHIVATIGFGTAPNLTAF